MKPQIRSWLFLLLITGLLNAILNGCSKKDDPVPDLASVIAGTYNGTVTVSGVGTVPASTAIVKVNETRVNLVLTISTSTIPMDGIKVSSSSKNSYTLAYSDPSGSLTGTVVGNTLNLTLTAGTYVVVFTGTR